MHTILRGATVVDGTGRPRQVADVEVVDGRIGAVGRIPAADGAEEVDLTGLVLAPGFVDIHTHYDAQVFWDGALSPSSWHGVTTVVIGNCGFGIAPARPHDRDVIMQTLQLVEGMNYDTLRAGIPWGHETYPEYLDALRALPKRVNVAAFVPHSMLRLYVMGEEAAFSRGATEQERAEITRLLREAMQAGAIGFSTSQAPSHQGPQGRPIPSRFADRTEITDMLGVLGAMGRGVAEITYGPLYEIEDCARLSIESGVPITWGSVLPGLFGPAGAAMEMLERGDAAGGRLWPQTSTRFISTQMSWQNPYQWSRLPAVKQVLGTTRETMAAAFADPAWRDRARAEMVAAVAEDADFLDGDLEGYFRRTSVEETVLHADLRGIPLQELAGRREVHPMDLMFDLALEEDLETRFRTRSPGTYEELRDLVTDPRTVLGAHDGGAHVDMLCDACYPTYTLRYWVREQGEMTLEQAVHRMSGHPAEVFGLHDCGHVAPGMRADLVAFDPDTVGEEPVERVHDLPAGADRLVAASTGIEHVWVGGVATRRDGREVEQVAPGAVVR